MKIVVLYKKDSGCDFHRLLLPYNNFPLQKGDSILMINNQVDLKHEILKDTDFIIFNRVCSFDVDILLRWRTNFGYTYRIVCDLDDYWHLNPTHEYYEDWRRTNHSAQIEDHIKLSDVITVTHERLAEKVRKFNQRVYIFPNALPYDEDQFLSSPNEVEENVKILYSMGTSHYHDLRSIRPTICKMKNLNVRFIAAGYNADNEPTLRFWKRVENLISCNPNSFFKEGLPLDKYMDHMDVCNISIAPLENNSFTWGKSILKALESGAKNRPIVCSDVYPYSSLKRVDGVYLCRNNQDWYSTIQHLSRNPNEIVSKGQALGDYVRKNFHLKDVNRYRYDVLQSLLHDPKSQEISINQKN